MKSGLSLVSVEVVLLKMIISRLAIPQIIES